MTTTILYDTRPTDAELLADVVKLEGKRGYLYQDVKLKDNYILHYKRNKAAHCYKLIKKIN